MDATRTLSPDLRRAPQEPASGRTSLTSRATGIAFVACALVDTLHPATLVTGSWWLVLLLVWCLRWPGARDTVRCEPWPKQMAALIVFAWIFFRANTAVQKSVRTWQLFEPGEPFHGLTFLLQDAIVGAVAAALLAVPLLRAFRHEAAAGALVIAAPWIVLTGTDTAFEFSRWRLEPWSQYQWLFEAVFPALLLMCVCQRLAHVARQRSVAPGATRSRNVLASLLRGEAGLGPTAVAAALAATLTFSLGWFDLALPMALVTMVPLLGAGWEIALVVATLLLTLSTIALIRALDIRGIRLFRWRRCDGRSVRIVAVLLLAPAWGLTVLHAAPVIGASAHYTVRRLPVPVWSIHYDDRARVIHLSGTYGPGVARDLIDFLVAHDDAVAVELSGPGGRLREGMQIAEVIEARGLATIVRTRCSSACTYAFVGGRERIVSGSGALGFHASRSPSVLVQWLRDTDREDAFRSQRGLDDQFIARVNAVPGHEIWYPTRDELVAAGVVTEVR